MNQKPKIAILSLRNSYNYGGVLSSLKVVYEFCETYFEPTVFFLGFDPEISTSLKTLKFASSVKPLTYFGMNCYEIGARWAFWEPGHYVHTLPHWRKLLQGYDYFFVVSGTCIAAHPLVQLNKKFTMWIGTPYNEDRTERVKQLTGFRRFLDTCARKPMNHIEKKILKKSSFTWTISSYAKDKFETIIQQKKNNLVLCGYPIDCENVPGINPHKEKIILAVGRYSDPRKNIDMLLRVFAKIHEKIPSIKLYIVGKKPCNEKLFSFFDLPYFKNVIFTGQVGSSDLTNLYRVASLLLITSYQEGLGIVGLESLLHGTPVIATNCGGTQDYVIDDQTGYLVQVNDDQAMIDLSLKVLLSTDLHHHLSINGRKLIEEKFSTKKIHALFKHGLTTTYPELASWFEEQDKLIANAQQSQPHQPLVTAPHLTL
jgi:glycosyltransferase involved in cell wall biosynthesis